MNSMPVEVIISKWWEIIISIWKRRFFRTIISFDSGYKEFSFPFFFFFEAEIQNNNSCENLIDLEKKGMLQRITIPQFFFFLSFYFIFSFQQIKLRSGES